MYLEAESGGEHNGYFVCRAGENICEEGQSL